MFRWHIVDSTIYHAYNNKIDNDLYFLRDTKEIYRGEIPFTESVIGYTGEVPSSSIAINRLYINTDTFEGKIYDGSIWKTVIKPYFVSNIIIEDPSDEHWFSPVNSKAVIEYVASKLSKVEFKSITHIYEDESELYIGINNTDNTNITGLLSSVDKTSIDGKSSKLILTSTAFYYIHDANNTYLPSDEIATKRDIEERMTWTVL